MIYKVSELQRAYNRMRKTGSVNVSGLGLTINNQPIYSMEFGRYNTVKYFKDGTMTPKCIGYFQDDAGLDD